MNYQNIKYGRATEWRRGQVGLELFKSQAEVEENGGVINAGTVLDGVFTTLDGDNGRIDYPNCLYSNDVTIMFRSKALSIQTGSAGVTEIVGSRAWAAGAEKGVSVGLNGTFGVWVHYGDGTNKLDAGVGTGVDLTTAGWQHIAVTLTHGGNVVVYVDGVSKGSASLAAVTGNVISERSINILGSDNIGSRYTNGSIKEVRILNSALSAEEILAYYNGTMWDYDKDCVLWLDGKLDSYDPTNVRALDRSGNDNHLAFGDSVTPATYPTKLTERPGGYVLDGNDDYFDTGSTLVANNVGLTVAAFIKNTDIVFNNRTLASHGSAAGGSSWFLQNSPSAGDPMQFRVVIGSTKDAQISVNEDDIVFLCGVHDLNTARVYRDSEYAEVAAVGSRNACTTNVLIGEDGYGTNFKGNIYALAIFKTALNQMQVIDLNIRLEQDRRA